MTDLTTRSATTKNEAGGATGSRRSGTGDPGTKGRTTIADAVVAKIAAAAAREVPGIHGLGTGMTRALGSVRDRVPAGRPGQTRGVSVEVGERQTAVDIDVVVEYGYPITDVIADMRTSVVTALERMTGLEVVEVNVAVGDVHLPDEPDEESSDGPRVT
ncbi:MULTISPECIES: Asp23/Gls24 family envelope stress response protein [unclassified Streptomyces]|uniref:Asp23/Gls24 family envelope stress response protein n=1 Tax=unclassified Streptomyces TaxID=2593676 RepID=UPI0034447F2B